MLRRRSVAVPLALAILVALQSPSPAAGATPALQSQVVQTGLVNPWDVAFAPNGQMFVTERPGRVRVFAHGGSGARLLNTTSLPGVHAAGEAGVMGIAVDPAFRTTRWVYVCVSRDVRGQWINQVIRYHVTHGWRLEHSKTLIRSGMLANNIHNGCAVEIGPDRKLWVSMGDAGQPALAQDPNSLNGKILRLNRDGSVPADNPTLPGATARSIAYSMGHRNPQGIAFQPQTGRVYAVEHGPDRSDEINWVRPGLNYGWPCVTGNNDPYRDWYPACGTNGPFTPPVWESGPTTIATSGGTFVRGDNWQAFRGQLFVAQLKESDLRRFRIRAGGLVAVQRAIYLDDQWGRLRAAVFGPHQRLWITTSNGADDKVIRVTPIPS